MQVNDFSQLNYNPKFTYYVNEQKKPQLIRLRLKYLSLNYQILIVLFKHAQPTQATIGLGFKYKIEYVVYLCLHFPHFLCQI